MENLKLNDPMQESGATPSLRNHPGLDQESPKRVECVRSSSRMKIFSFFLHELKPIVYCAVFGLSVGAVVLNGIERKIDQEKEKLLGPIAADQESISVIEPISSGSVKSKLSPDDIDAFVEELVVALHMPDKRELFKIAMDPKSTDQEKAQQIARLLLSNNPKNRELMEKALMNFLKKWLAAQAKEPSGS